MKRKLIVLPTRSTSACSRVNRLGRAACIAAGALFVLASCHASTVKEVSEHAARGKCEKAEQTLADYQLSSQALQKTKSVTGTAASAALMGVTVVTESLLYLTGGLTVGAIICSPIIAIEVAANSKGEASVECVLRIGTYVTAAMVAEGEYSVARHVWQGTSKWRVESYDEISGMLSSIAQCRMERGESGDLAIAEKQLAALHGGLWPRLSKEEQARIEALDRKLAMIKRARSEDK